MDRSHRSLIAVLSLVAAGCSEGFDDGASEPDAAFYGDIEPILRESCQSCHHSEGIAPFSLVTYEEASRMAGPIANATEEGSMPPWGARDTAECTPRFGWKHDARLMASQIETLRAWADDGAPRGDAEDALPSFSPPSEGLAGATLEATPRVPYVTSGDSDQFPCFVMDPQIAELGWVTGMHVLPGNPKVVHHAVVFWDPTGATEALADAEGKFDCQGGAVELIPDPRLLQVWVPGSVPWELPPQVAVPIEPGGRLVMQIHYHPAGVSNDPDLTTVQLRLDQRVPEYVIAPGAPVGNFAMTFPNGDGLQPGMNDRSGGAEFFVPSGASDHQEEMVLTWPATVPGSGEPMPTLWLYGAAAHMHLVGVDLKVDIERAAPQDGEPASECLLHEPAWNFDWQRFYSYDTPLSNLPSLRPGDRLRVRCRYDNTMDNSLVRRGLLEQGLPMPIDVTLGEETLDEMCLAMLPVIARIQ